MPPKPSNHAQFPVSDPDNEVVCPIKQGDGTNCRKRCLGEKRYRSMQEHIRRAHPEYYIAKLPATKESFEMMINTPPHEVPKPTQQETWSPPSERRERYHIQSNGLSDSSGLSYATHESFDLHRSFGQGGQQNDGFYHGNIPTFEVSRAPPHLRRASMLPAAAALTQLHYARDQGDWDDDNVGMFMDHSVPKNDFFEGNGKHFGDPTLSAGQQFLDTQYSNDPMDHSSNGNGHLDVMSSTEQSPPNRSAAPAVQRISHKTPGRQRKSSVSHNARRPKHERRSSKDFLRPTSHDRKAPSAEPGGGVGVAAIYGKRWEDLIDAATSATEEDSRDLTPIPGSPFHSPRPSSRTPMAAPFALGAQFQSYTASPLQQALTPPPPDGGPHLFTLPNADDEAPSIDSSVASGAQFHILPGDAAADSSPMFSVPVQIYCAGCRRLSVLRESFACTECICGLCGGCVDALLAEQARGRATMCPKCGAGGRFKAFQLDIR